MPRPARFSVEVIFDAIKDLPFFDDNGVLKNLSADVWDDATNKMQSRLTKKHIYLYVSRNDHGILTMLKERHNVNPKPNTPISQNELSHDSNWSMDASREMLDPLRVTIHISEETWNGIRPHNVVYADGRDYRVLRQGWTDVMQDELWKQHRLPCCYSFRNPRVTDRPGEMFLSIKGACTECGTKINMYTLDKPTENGITLHVSTSDTKGIKHSKKRQLRGVTRRNVVKELDAMTTYGWRRKKANTVMNYGDVEPAHLFSEQVLRRAKQTETDRELGLGKVGDVISSVREIKYRPEFVGFIREIGLDKFFVMYWSLQQIDQYKKFVKQASVENCRITIDATGSVVAQLARPDGSTSPMFLYQAVISFGGKILPIFQMISEKHDANIITYWLREWLRSCASTPKEVVTDYSLALLNAVSLAFETTDLRGYVNRCFDFIRGTRTGSEPSCWIRIDIAHLIKLGARWNCYGKATAHVKEFYLRCLGLLTKCARFEIFEGLLRDILTVAFSETESIDSLSKCFNAQKRIIDIIKNDENSNVYTIVKARVDREKKRRVQQKNKRLVKRRKRQTSKPDCKHVSRRQNSKSESSDCSTEIADSDLSTSSNDASARYSDTDDPDTDRTGSVDLDIDDDQIDSESRTCDSIREFMLKLVQDCKQDSKFGDRQNPYWCPKFAQNLVRICQHFPLWTNIVRPNASPASSARSEEYFRQVKKFTLKGDRNIRLDKFLIKHIRSISGAEKLSEAAFQRESSKSQNSDDLVEVKKTAGAQSTVEEAQRTTKSVDEETVQFFEANVNDKNEDSDIFVAPIASNISFLHEEEDWRGKNSRLQGRISKSDDNMESVMENNGEGTKIRKVKRGKYLTSCPDIESILERPRANGKLPLLKQGHLQPSCRVAGKVIRLTNTCAFDCLAQSILAGYSDWIIYRDYVETSQNAFFDFVKSLSISGVSGQTYNRRAVLLSGVSVVTDNVMDCHSNVSSMITTKFLTDVPSYLVSQSCLDCNSTSLQSQPVVNVDVKPFYERGMTALEAAIREKISQATSNACIRCRSNNTDLTVTVGQHLFVDLECLQWSRLAQNLGHDNWEGSFTISQITPKLQLCGATYNIVSIIEYIGDTDPESVGHYIAYIRRITGKWEIYNNVSRANGPILATSRALLQKRKISILMYVKV